MKTAIEDIDLPIFYVEKFREYGVKVLDGGTSYISIGYCPWCGRQLPASLRDRWFEELERQGLDPFKDPVPEEFEDDRWYKLLKDDQ